MSTDTTTTGTVDTTTTHDERDYGHVIPKDLRNKLSEIKLDEYNEKKEHGFKKVEIDNKEGEKEEVLRTEPISPDIQGIIQYGAYIKTFLMKFHNVIYAERSVDVVTDFYSVVNKNTELPVVRLKEKSVVRISSYGNGKDKKILKDAGMCDSEIKNTIRTIKSRDNGSLPESPSYMISVIPPSVIPNPAYIEKFDIWALSLPLPIEDDDKNTTTQLVMLRCIEGIIINMYGDDKKQRRRVLYAWQKAECVSKTRPDILTIFIKKIKDVVKKTKTTTTK